MTVTGTWRNVCDAGGQEDRREGSRRIGVGGWEDRGTGGQEDSWTGGLEDRRIGGTPFPDCPAVPVPGQGTHPQSLTWSLLSASEK